jgi:hypothetical protein
MMKKIHDAGFTIAEVPVHHYHRAYGKSQFFNFRRLVRTAFDVFGLWQELVWRRAPARDARADACVAPATADHEAATAVETAPGLPEIERT